VLVGLDGWRLVDHAGLFAPPQYHAQDEETQSKKQQHIHTKKTKNTH